MKTIFLKILLLFTITLLFSCNEEEKSNIPSITINNKILYVSPDNNESMPHGVIWGAHSELGASSRTDGKFNTKTVYDIIGNWVEYAYKDKRETYACKECESLNNNNYLGHNDWYLPSIEELQALYKNRQSLPRLSEGRYWSSTESSNDYALSIVFGNHGILELIGAKPGDVLSEDKQHLGLVRCVRTGKIIKKSYNPYVWYKEWRIERDFPTKKIGTKEWCIKNLNESSYANGDAIPEVQDANEWQKLTTGAWCYYTNNSDNGNTSVGKLYNWYAINDPRGIVPAGFHIPSKAEWKRLTENLDDDNFSGIRGGYRSNNGSFMDASNIGYWWSSTEEEGGIAYSFCLGCNEGDEIEHNKKDGLSVRCIKD